MRMIDIAYRTMFAELAQRSLDAAFEADFPVEGRFVSVPVKGRNYWYYDPPAQSGGKRLYVGPEADPEITSRVQAFREIKSDHRARRKLVSTLVREAGLTAPDPLTGDVVAALARAGFFRLRGVLVGTVAFQSFEGLLGVRLPAASIQTGDADFAQFHSISAAVGDEMPSMLSTLTSIDPTFREIPHASDGRASTRFMNAGRFLVEFLTPNRGSADHDGRPAGMPSLGGASAEPLRFLDFLIHQPVRSLLLHGPGIAVNVPAPERYAIHKLIIAARRRGGSGDAKRDKDAFQAGLLMAALAEQRRQTDLASVFEEAWHRGDAWRRALAVGFSMLGPRERQTAREAIASGLRSLGEDPAEFAVLDPDRPPSAK